MEVAGPFSIATSYLWGVVTWGQWLHLDQNGDSDGFHQEKIHGNTMEYAEHIVNLNQSNNWC